MKLSDKTCECHITEKLISVIFLERTKMLSGPLFLGLDLSTQQLKALIIDKDSRAIHHAAVHFDRDLPHHRTKNGALQGPDKGEVTSPVQMWLEAVDLLFA